MGSSVEGASASGVGQSQSDVGVVEDLAEAGVAVEGVALEALQRPFSRHEGTCHGSASGIDHLVVLEEGTPIVVGPVERREGVRLIDINVVEAAVHEALAGPVCLWRLLWRLVAVVVLVASVSLERRWSRWLRTGVAWVPHLRVTVCLYE